MSSSHAIVLVGETPQETKTVFGQFVDALFSGREEDTVTGHGSFHWNSVPIEEAIAGSLWPVLIRMAEKMGKDLKTPSNVSVISKPVYRYLSAGLEISYPNMGAAASAFRTLFESDIVVPLKPVMIPSSKMFMERGARFFGDAIRVTLDRLDRLQKAHDGLLRRQVKKTASGNSYTLFDNQSINQAATIINRYQLNARNDWVNLHFETYTWSGLYLDETVRGMEAMLTFADLLEALPHRLDRLPLDLTTLDVPCISMNWLRTQLAICACGIESLDREHLEESEVDAAMERILGTDEAVLIDRLVVRFRDRGMRELARFESELRELASETIGDLRRPRSFGPAGLFLVRVDMDRVELDQDSMYRLIVNPESLSITFSSSSHTYQTMLRRAKAELDWSALSFQQIKQLIKRGEGSWEELVDKSGQLRPDIRARVVSEFLGMNGGNVRAELLVKLFRKQLLPKYPGFITKVLEHVQDEELEEAILLWIQVYYNGESDPSTEHAFSFLMALYRTSATFQRSLIERTDVRGALCWAQAHANDWLLDTKRFLPHPAFWREFRLRTSLSEIVILREGTYVDWERSDVETRKSALIPWNLISSSKEVLDVRKDFRITQRSLAAQLRRLTEEVLFRWRFVQDQDVEEHWANYVALQKMYMLQESTTAPPCKKAKKSKT